MAGAGGPREAGGRRGLRRAEPPTPPPLRVPDLVRRWAWAETGAICWGQLRSVLQISAQGNSPSKRSSAPGASGATRGYRALLEAGAAAPGTERRWLALSKEALSRFSRDSIACLRK